MTWAEDVYAIDHRGAEICRQMTIDGFAFDAERAKSFALTLAEQERAMRDQADDAAGSPIRRTKTGGFAQKGAGSLPDAFFNRLRAPIFFRSEFTKQPSLNANALRAYAGSQNDRLRRLALAVIDYKRLRSTRRMYVEKVAAQLGDDGRVHAGWLNYGTVSGRWSCQQPNLMNLPRRESDPVAHLGGVRSLYVAAPGHRLVKFDYKQLEFRIAAYASKDPRMMAVCEAGDVHSANASVVIGKIFDELSGSVATHRDCDCALCGKRAAFRTIAKTSAFAVCYLAEAPTVHARIAATWKDDWGPVPLLRATEALLRKMRNGFATYYEWQEARRLDCIRTGWTDTPILGRRRMLGHDPKAPECANYPIQGGAADLMNAATPAIIDEIAARRLPAKMVAQVHDSCVYECRESACAELVSICKEICERPQPQLNGASFPIDIEVAERWH